MLGLHFNAICFSTSYFIPCCSNLSTRSCGGLPSARQIQHTVSQKFIQFAGIIETFIMLYYYLYYYQFPHSILKDGIVYYLRIVINAVFTHGVQKLDPKISITSEKAKWSFVINRISTTEITFMNSNTPLILNLLYGWLLSMLHKG